MDLSIIIVSYNTSDLIGTCLASVIASDDVIKKEIFIVDNASTDGSAAFIRNNFPSVLLIENTENRGFAAANNQILTQCNGRYIFFLNPDTSVMPGTFKEAVSFMDACPYIGLAGTKIINPDGSHQDSVSYRYPGEKYTAGELSGLPGQIACVLGAGMIAHAKLIKDMRGFDEDFFLYGEDEDLCLRIRKSEYEIGYINSAVVVHYGGQSERPTTSSEVWKKKTNAEFLFYQKHYLPETIARIKRAHLLKTRWRIAALKLTIPFCKDKANVKEKLIKYQAIQDEICKIENSIKQKK
ncbi:MAG: glycosyltransferase family 2 protein [Deltaproteobacteria bacterium]|nr:glycosyltransferase family 2 protein [Deltaproteobacteria bacterium]